MKDYEPEKFVDALNKKMERAYPSCPFCGKSRHVVTGALATIIVGKNVEVIEIERSMPSGIVVCENCGHIDFFALGYLGLLKKDGETRNEGSGAVEK